jgi:hypothetical protein
VIARAESPGPLAEPDVEAHHHREARDAAPRRQLPVATVHTKYQSTHFLYEEFTDKKTFQDTHRIMLVDLWLKGS